MPNISKISLKRWFSPRELEFLKDPKKFERIELKTKGKNINTRSTKKIVRKKIGRVIIELRKVLKRNPELFREGKASEELRKLLYLFLKTKTASFKPIDDNLKIKLLKKVGEHIDALNYSIGERNIKKRVYEFSSSI